MNPLIIESIAAEQVRDRQHRAARERQARQIRRSAPRAAGTARSRGPLFPHRVLRIAT